MSNQVCEAALVAELSMNETGMRPGRSVYAVPSRCRTHGDVRTAYMRLRLMAGRSERCGASSHTHTGLQRPPAPHPSPRPNSVRGGGGGGAPAAHRQCTGSAHPRGPAPPPSTRTRRHWRVAGPCTRSAPTPLPSPAANHLSLIQPSPGPSRRPRPPPLIVRMHTYIRAHMYTRTPTRHEGRPRRHSA